MTFRTAYGEWRSSGDSPPPSPMFADSATPMDEGEVLAESKRVQIRSDHAVLVSLAQLAEEILAELHHIRVTLGSSSEDRTSVKIETGSKRELKATVHVYAGDTDQAANTWLVQEAIRVHGLTQAYCDEGSVP